MIKTSFLSRALLIVVILSMFFSGSVLAGETVFRELSWGDPPESLGESIDITGDGDRAARLEARRKVNENYELGPVRVNEISYVFFEGQLLMIMIKADKARVLSEIARAKYGKAFNSNRFMIDEAYQHKDTFCSVKENVVAKTGTMTLSSINGLRRYQQWQKEQAEAASKAF